MTTFTKREKISSHIFHIISQSKLIHQHVLRDDVDAYQSGNVSRVILKNYGAPLNISQLQAGKGLGQHWICQEVVLPKPLQELKNQRKLKESLFSASRGLLASFCPWLQSVIMSIMRPERGWSKVRSMARCQDRVHCSLARKIHSLWFAKYHLECDPQDRNLLFWHHAFNKI